MKINRFKALAFFLVFIALAFLSIQDSVDIVSSFQLPSARMKVSGAINDASTFAFAWIMFVLSVFLGMCFITGRQLKWIPKIVLIILWILTLIPFLAGWGINIALKNELNKKGYIECKSERELTLKYSSRTYVLPPKTCD
ncbi:MAG: hypothetical protein ACK5NC_01835 [Vibrio sp.]